MAQLPLNSLQLQQVRVLLSQGVAGGGEPGPAGPAGPGTTSSIVATEPIPAFSAVTSQGKVGNTATTSQIGKVFGVAPAAISNGFPGVVQTLGDVTNPAWSWSAGDRLFLNGASISNTPPASGFIQSLGTAKSPQTIVVEIGVPILI